MHRGTLTTKPVAAYDAIRMLMRFHVARSAISLRNVGFELRQENRTTPAESNRPAAAAATEMSASVCDSGCDDRCGFCIQSAPRRRIISRLFVSEVRRANRSHRTIRPTQTHLAPMNRDRKFRRGAKVWTLELQIARKRAAHAILFLFAA